MNHRHSVPPSSRVQTSHPVDPNNLAKTSERIALNLIRILSAGPEVSLSGSPTVSPITAALCSSVPFLLTSPLTIRCPASIYFFALSQAPPVLDDEIAIYTPLTSAPGSRPAIAFGPKIAPMTNGVNMTKAPGANISLREAYVDILTHLS